MNTVLYLVSGAVLTALTGALAFTGWRCVTLRRALLRERAASRLADYVCALDAAADQRAAYARRAAAVGEADVLAQADAVLDAVLATTGSDLPRGGNDG